MRLIDADAMLEYLDLMYDTQDDWREPYNTGVLGAIDYIKHKAPTIDPKAKVIAQVTFDEDKLREIVHEAVERIKEEYDIVDGWIPCSERLPSECDMFLITWTASVTNEPLLAFAEYEPDAFLVSGGKWYLEDDMREFKDVDVIAWMPLPAPYKEENGKR